MLMVSISTPLTALALQAPRGPQGPNRVLTSADKFCWKRHCNQLTSQQFKLMYRVDERSFDILLGWIRPYITVKDELQATRSRKAVGAIPP